MLTQIDYFTKYVEAIPLSNKGAATVTHDLYKTYCRYGALAQVISDQGGDFFGKKLTD